MVNARCDFLGYLPAFLLRLGLVHVGTVLTRVHQLIAPRHTLDGVLAIDVRQSCNDFVQFSVSNRIILNEQSSQTFLALKVERGEVIMFGCYQMEVLVS